MVKSVFTKPYKMYREQLRKARVDSGLSQEDLAKRLGWDQTYVSKIERGVRRVDVVELIGICEALRLDAADFVRQLQQDFGR